MATNVARTKNEWIAARKQLLAKEKELTRMRDALSAQRRALPWLRVEKSYVFDTPKGRKSLADLFEGRSQLAMYHFMFAPEWEAGCKSCSFWAESFDRIPIHLAHRDVTFLAVSRAPLDKLQAYARRFGWSFPWVSSAPSDFNYDFNVSFTEEQQRSGNVNYNYEQSGVRSESRAIPASDATEGPHVELAASVGTDWPTYIRETPGMSAFALEDGIVYHTYSAYARGVDGLWGLYQWLDRAPRGRNETGFWIRRRDEYEKGVSKNCCA